MIKQDRLKDIIAEYTDLIECEEEVNLVILEKDINIISGGFRLREHSNKLKKYNQLQQVAIAADNYLKIISELNDDFVSLEQII
ncbi:hypothetical protein [Clostridium gasigenes]|uniref:hypothetical protein n=1 Tax=Clostridium gasigenes TaxID=94869 RepID=UPI001C0BD1DC|nr:hypothetical protein [Clostridium gasigenes]MBU3106986.1 hypothetical protein [Clostridium gasigenes]